MRIIKEETAAVIIDIQERLFPHIASADGLLRRTGMLVEGLKILQVPVMVTEQYPKGLGKTVREIVSLLKETSPIEKTAFSCCDEPVFMEKLQQLNCRFVIAAGIEAHVCVLQTCLDLLERKYTPVVMEDCTGSRKKTDKHTALERLKQEGVLVSSSESLLFELCRTAGTDQFRMISRLVK